MPVAAPEALQVGTRVAYEDAANPRREGRIVEVVYPRCPGCGVVSSSPDAEHLDACRFQGREALPQGIVEYRVRFDDPDGEPCRCAYPDKCFCKGDEVTSDLRQCGWHQIADWPGNNPFDGADIVLSYTREQALADGELVALDSIAQEAGFVWPVALTRPLWNYIDATDEEQARMQSTNGRLWDVLSMARFGISARKHQGGDESSFDFRVLFYNLGRGRSEAGRKTKRLRIAVGPGDQGEPVVTIGFPEDF